MKTARDWLSERPLASENQERWVQCIMDASRLNLTSDDIFTLKVWHDELKIIQPSNMTQNARLITETLSKILRQCEGQKFEGE